jgi:hypothetical protein
LMQESEEVDFMNFGASQEIQPVPEDEAGVHENQHSIDVEYPPPSPRVCMCFHREGESCL